MGLYSGDYPVARVIIQDEEVCRRPSLWIDALDVMLQMPATRPSGAGIELGDFWWFWAIPDPANQDAGAAQGRVECRIYPSAPIEPQARMIGFFGTNNLDYRGGPSGAASDYWQRSPRRGYWIDDIFHPHGDAELFLNWRAPRDVWHPKALNHYCLPAHTLKCAYRVEVGAIPEALADLTLPRVAVLFSNDQPAYISGYGGLYVRAVLPEAERMQHIVQVNLAPTAGFATEKFKGPSAVSTISNDVVESKRWIPVITPYLYVQMTGQGQAIASVLNDGIWLKRRR